MSTCHECNRRFPTQLINQMFVSNAQGQGYINCCPICALRITNEVHGTNRQNFNGEIAQANLVAARAFLAETSNGI